MAITKSYTRISTIALTYGEIRTYAKYSSQSTTNNTTTYQLKSTYYTTQGGGVSFSSATASLDGTTRSYGYTTMPRGETTISEVSRTIKHNNSGSSPTKTVATSWSATFGGSGSTSANITFPAIKRFATITNSPSSLTDESDPWFSFSNPAGASMSCWLEVRPSTTHIATRSISGSSGTYTWTLTEPERTQLRQQMTTANAGKIRIVLKSTVGSSSNTTYVEKPFSIINANPIFNDFEFEDINPLTLALTGDNSVNVNGFSNIKITIPELSKAEAIKEASMVKYRCIIGEASSEITYKDDDDVSTNINNASRGTYNVYAVDSRNNSTLVTKLATNEIAYDKVYIDKQSSYIERDDNRVGDGAILTLNGTFWNGDFGDVNNSISVSYQLKKSNSDTWINGTTTITPTITDDKFSFTGQIASDNLDTSWNLEDSYDIKIIVEDELSINEYITILNSAIPTMSFDREGVGIMCAYDSSLGGGLQVNGERIDNTDIYDETETKTNKIWIDNKPIYRKVIEVTSPSQNNTLDPSISNLDKIVSVYGMAKRKNSTYFNPMPGNYTNWEIYLYDVSASHLMVRFSNNQWNNGVDYFYVVIEYTKSTN